ncbi:MAG: hypothetical protein WBA12_06670 [Catalinimonas sp.]
MLRTLPSILLLALLFACGGDELPDVTTDTDLQFAWSRLMNGPSDEDEIDAVAADDAGNVYLSGKFEDSLRVAGRDGAIRSVGRADIMVVKYDAGGALRWVKCYGGPGEDNIFDATCDDQGNLILSGYFEGTVSFGSFTLTAVGGLDMVLLKLSPDGEVLRAVRFGGAGDDGGNEVAVGPGNQVVVGAQSDGTFEGITNTGGQDAHLLSLTSDFVVNWIRTVEGAGAARAKAVAVDAGGNVYLGGDYRGANGIRDAGGAFLNLGGTDAYLASWTAAGAWRWVKNWGGPGNDLCKGVAATAQGALFAVGQFTGTVDFDGTPLTSTPGSQDLFVWKLDDGGAPTWLRHVRAPENLTGAEVTTDEQDRLYFGLGIGGPVEFQSGDNAFERVVSCGGRNCPVLVRYDADGNFSTSLRAERSNDARFGELAYSGRTVYVDCVLLGGPHVIGGDTLTSQGGTKDAAVVAIEVE